MMKILVVGSGGREHALVWRLRQSPHVTRIYSAPGNAGIGELAELVPLPSTDIPGLVRFARELMIDLTVVGPEQPLAEGIVDLFRENGLKIFGPTKAAAEIEWSKVFAKRFMTRHGIPTAEFRSFNVSQRFEAERYINEIPVPIVMKADGLASGKGVAVCETKERALENLDDLMGRKILGDAGMNLVIEEFLVGEEASVLALTDGKEFFVFPPAQDHKRILDNDQGKNTGGMGAYAPAPIVTDPMLDKIKRTIIRPTLLGLAKEDRPFQGCLYCGLMITETGPKVVEYNSRLGDPEAQVVLSLLDSDLLDVLLEVAEGKLLPSKLKWKEESAVCVVLASRGYPDNFEVGKPIVGLDAAETEQGVKVFHAGTWKEKESVVTSGGRVIGVTAVGAGDSLERTIDKAYRAVNKITFDGAYYRSDIGKKGVERLKMMMKEMPQ
jgi:phosphoribosylamine---glycine ligase